MEASFKISEYGYHMKNDFNYTNWNATRRQIRCIQWLGWTREMTVYKT